MTNPRVSVICIFLNGERFIAEAIESVLAQDCPDWELLLVDDGSTDTSTAIAQGYGRQLPDKISYLEHEKHANRGMSTSRNLSDIRFDEIYHVASPASPPWYMREPSRTISSNLVGAIRGLELLQEGGKFCYTSTSEMYGEPLVSPQPESYRGFVDCTGPRSSYDEAKRVTESLLFETRRTRGLDLRVVRLFNAYGPRTRPDDGRAISNFIAQALAGRPITVQGDGSHSRSWGYASDIVEGLSRFFWRDTFACDGPLNIGNDREIPVLDVARRVAELAGDCPIVFAPPMPQDPTNRCPDLTLARQILPGWTCHVPYE